MPLATVILFHDAPPALGGPHHDWMIENPTQPADSPLWTARITPPPADWAASRTFDLTPLPPHRRAYLTYEGPLSGSRGAVRRVDEGHAEAVTWSSDRITLDVTLKVFRGRIELTRLSDGRWRAMVIT